LFVIEGKFDYTLSACVDVDYALTLHLIDFIFICPFMMFSVALMFVFALWTNLVCNLVIIYMLDSSSWVTRQRDGSICGLGPVEWPITFCMFMLTSQP